MKNQKGITLIALIITIIVMLILAGVTISLVTGENGVMSQAENAGERQSYATAEERIRTQSEYITEGENVGKVNLAKTEENIRALDLQEIKDISSTKTLLTITLKDDSIIEISGENGGNEETILPEGLTVGSEFEMDADGDGTDETWIVLYDGTASHLNENEIEIISKNTMGNLTLGKGDTEAIANATDIDGDGTLEDIEIAIYSYNNATYRINNYCNSLIKISNLGVRSMGTTPSNPNYENASAYEINSNVFDGWSDEAKEIWNMYGTVVKVADNYSSSDLSQLTDLNLNTSTSGDSLWVPGRYRCVY